jgi:hypothetical protein
MEKLKWESCPFFREGCCPKSPVIDKAYLIPQLMAALEFEEAIRICKDCGQYFPERRRHFRLKRPFKSYLHKDHGDTTIPGNIRNVSTFGGLIQLEDWLPFHVSEKVKIEIFPRHRVTKKANNNIIKTLGEVRRIHSAKRELALSFLTEIDHQSLHSL